MIVIGGGPAGLTAGLYASRAGLKTLLIERGIFGGQIVNAQLVENYPGFPDGISGLDLASLMHKQAAKYGLETLMAEVTDISPVRPYTVHTGDCDFKAEAIIIAAGSEHRRLGVAGEEKLLGRGVSYCATCDGFLFRSRDVAIVGGGDTALTEALELSQHASRVYVIHRRDQLRGGHVLQQRAFADPKLKFVWNSVVEEITGEGAVSGLKLRNVKANEISTLPVGGVFVSIGLVPNSSHFASVVKLDNSGNIITDELMATSTAGIFAAGDIRRKAVRQVSTSVGDGAIAAMSAFKYLHESS